MLGYDSEIHYAYASFDYKSKDPRLREIYEECKFEIQNGLDFPEKHEFGERIETMWNDRFWFSVGGPVQTMLTGCLGLVLLGFRRQHITKNGFQLLDWLAVFLSLFWLREVFNLVMSLLSGIITQDGHYFGGDELYISMQLDFWEGTIPIVLAFIGVAVTLYVVSKVVPRQYRTTFISAGFIGGVIGYMLWLETLGPIVMP